MVSLSSRLSSYSIVALDTAVFIYHFEKNKRYFKLTRGIFSRLDEDAGFSALTSILTLLEICVKPIKESRQDLVKEYSNKILYDEKLTTFMVDEAIALKAAELRARYGIRVPDSIQIGTATRGSADAFITNDKSLQRVKELDVLILEDFL